MAEYSAVTIDSTIKAAFPQSQRWGWMTFIPPDRDIMEIRLATTTQAVFALDGTQMMLASSSVAIANLLDSARQRLTRQLIDELMSTVDELEKTL